MRIDDDLYLTAILIQIAIEKQIFSFLIALELDLNFRLPAFTIAPFPEFLGVWIVFDVTCFRVDVQNRLSAVGNVSKMTPKRAFLSFRDFLG